MNFRLALYRLPLILMCLLVTAPLLMLFKTWLSLDASIWLHLWQTQMLELVGNTVILLLGVGFGVSVIGVSLAWLTANCSFPGHRFFDWALILPLAIPAYVLAFVTLGIYDFGGVVQNLLRSMGYQGFFDARNPAMVVWVMTAVLYPYVYLLVRASFIAQGNHLIEVARVLGRSPWSAFFQVSLPAVRPALVAGMSLALMEALADFGAVSIFGFNTFTTAIYKSWISLFSLQTAAQLSTLLLLFVMLCLFSEKFSSKAIRRNARTLSRKRDLIPLQGYSKWIATGFCSLIFILTVVVPLIQLLIWAAPLISGLFEPEFVAVIARTFLLAAFAALLVVVLAIAVIAVPTTGSRFWREFATLGYALPGSVLAIGIMLALGGLDALTAGLGIPAPVLLGSLFGMILAYLIRFFRPGYGAVRTGFSALHQNYLDAAALMGVTGWQRFWRLSLPLILPGVMTGGLLVFVDVIKEMPASLLLRPFGWDTLAIKLYQLTSEGEWQRAALPALALVLVSLLPVILLIYRSQLSPSGIKHSELPAA
ncbi:MAG: ABC transporter permease [Porticoccaceae bacterium]